MMKNMVILSNRV